MKIFTFEVGEMNNLMYIVDIDNFLIIIDPSFGYDVFERYKGVNKKVEVLITHGHYDHVMDCEKMNYLFGDVNFYMNKSDEYFLPFKIQNLKDISLCDKLVFDKMTIKIIKTPGHSPGSVCYLIDNHLFTGDTLFYDCCGRVDLPGSDPKMMRQSLLKILKFDDDTIIHPGHNYGGSEIKLARARVDNPYLRAAFDEDLFLSIVL